jgi:hypothetical protein
LDKGQEQLVDLPKARELLLLKSAVEGVGKLLANLIETPNIVTVDEKFFYTGVQFGRVWVLMGAEEGFELSPVS